MAGSSQTQRYVAFLDTRVGRGVTKEESYLKRDGTRGIPTPRCTGQSLSDYAESINSLMPYDW